jgi:hypothetical protein
MCGACAGPPPDPAGALVVAAACPGLTVRAVAGGWTVATRTGRTTVCRTLDALARAAGPHARAGMPVPAGRPGTRQAQRVALEALRAATPSDGPSNQRHPPLPTAERRNGCLRSG